MGAAQFMTAARGESARAAFEEVTERARYESGHGGYSGTVAEKSSFVEIQPPAGFSPRGYANCLLEGSEDGVPEEARKKFQRDFEKVDDKWGPAGCVTLEPPAGDKPGRYLFFGWASE